MSPLLIGADHAGFSLKEYLKKELLLRGYSVTDATPKFAEGDDYPPIARQVAREIAKGKKLGILICGTGLGMDIAANRIKGVRAVVIRDEEDAKLSREHNHANILILGGRSTKPEKAKKLVDTWLQATPSREARHLRRVKQLDR
ncbi:MAG TPA: RpiB/LacA/LacB family sugar-phosphate isomerase [Patescibacteria group bacterium]|nr:RpiB/LacA/LacB family sugar-phosphate isomerase [Patescibacteria group bacterium]